MPEPLPRFYAIVDAAAAAGAGWPPLRLAAALLEGGARLLQLRAKDLSGRAFLDLTSATLALCRAAGARLIVNDRADLAALAGAAGVHVGQDDIGPADARRVAGPGAIIGVSTHTEAQLRAAVEEPVTYVAVGPVYRTRTKDTGYDAVGLDLVRRAAALATPRGLGVVAIGGVTLERAPEVWAAGASAVAVISDLMTADPAARAAAWVQAGDRASERLRS